MLDWAGMVAVTYAGLLAVIAVHEASHAAVARRLGLPCRRVIIGAGPRWCALRMIIAGVPVEVRPLPLGGLADIPFDRGTPLRARLVVTAAGPAGNVGLGVAMLLAVVGPVRTLQVAMAALGMLPGFVRAMVEAAISGGGVPLIMLPPGLPLTADAGVGVALAGVVSLLSAAMNLVPLPPLDGGWLLYWPLERRYPMLGHRMVRGAVVGVGGVALAVFHLPLLREPPWAWLLFGTVAMTVVDRMARWHRAGCRWDGVAMTAGVLRRWWGGGGAEARQGARRRAGRG